MVEIPGLSAQQQEMATRMWNLEDVYDIDAFISQLPRAARVQAQVVRVMMVTAQLDQIMDTDLAQSVIDSVK